MPVVILWKESHQNSGTSKAVVLKLSCTLEPPGKLIKLSLLGYSSPTYLESVEVGPRHQYFKNSLGGSKRTKFKNHCSKIALLKLQITGESGHNADSDQQVWDGQDSAFLKTFQVMLLALLLITSPKAIPKSLPVLSFSCWLPTPPCICSFAARTAANLGKVRWGVFPELLYQDMRISTRGS